MISILPALLIMGTTPSGDAAKAASSMNAFGQDVLSSVLKSEKGNHLFSGLSAASALTLLWSGSANQTEQLLAKALHLSGPGATVETDTKALFDALRSSGETTISNAVFLAPSLALGHEFATTASNVFGAEVEHLAPGAAGVRQINGWVDSATKHRIPKLVDSLGRNTDVVLTNAVTFDGKWEKAFEASNTHSANFHSSSGTQSVPMMGQTSTFGYREFPGYREADLPYKGGQFLMRILLPTSGGPSAALLDRAHQPEGSSMGRRLDLQVPKFTFGDEIELKDPLEMIGLGAIFQRGDFSKIAHPGGPNKVDRVIQKTWIQVDESGTKAAAATGVMMSRALATRPQPIIPFHVDRPFAFEIVHAPTGAVLFSGVVNRVP